MPNIEDFFGNYKFSQQGNTNPRTYPPGQPVSIGPSPTLQGTAILQWGSQGTPSSVDQIPFNGKTLTGRNLTGRVGPDVYPVDVQITLILPNQGETGEGEEGKTVTGDLLGQSAGPLVGQWGAETQPPPFEIGRPAGERAVQTAIA